MTGNSLTRVELAFYPEHLNYWLRFGSPVDRIELDKRRSLAVFEPGQVFGYVRWSANEFGTQDWRLTVLEAQEPHIMLSRVPGVSPGVDVLLLVKGKGPVKRTLAVLDQLETDGFPLEDVSPSYYRHVHVRVTANRKIRSYSQDQHKAHLAEKRVRP
ncbi:DUF2840 domain-containing protein [Kordiimonas sp.]|uniref:DUF2840 domain-containing protein n=1 Tax=Kordiimonas sp. TaxID=1970157 RepID=UPI003A8F2E5B